MTNQTSNSLFLQCEARIRFTLLHPHVSKVVLAKKADQIAHHDQHVKDCKFEISQREMVCNFCLSGPKWIQGTILKQTGSSSYVVNIDSGVKWKQHVNHL